MYRTHADMPKTEFLFLYIDEKGNPKSVVTSILKDKENITESEIELLKRRVLENLNTQKYLPIICHDMTAVRTVFSNNKTNLNLAY